jgi:hypothetical protein
LDCSQQMGSGYSTGPSVYGQSQGYTQGQSQAPGSA